MTYKEQEFKKMNNLKDISISNLEEFNCLLDRTSFQLDPDWEDYNQLNAALQDGQKDKAKLLIQNGARVNKCPAGFNVCTPLHFAVMVGCPEIVKMLLDKGASVNIRNNNRETPLIIAAKMGKNVITDLLLSVHEQENRSNRENLTHMHIACMRNRVDVVKKLMQHGVRINHAVKLNSLHWPGYTPLHFAVQFQCIETVQFLIKCGADITIKEKLGLTPLHFANTLRNEVIIDLILAAHQYEITNPANSEGLTHFHIACTRNNPIVVECFLKQGINVNIKVLESSLNWAGYRPINFAIDYKCTNVIELLLSYDANLNLCDTVCNPIQYGYKTVNKTIIDILLSKHTIKKSNFPKVRKLSNLHAACILDDVNIIEELIHLGNFSNKPIDLNLPIWTGCTPLHLAVKHKCMKTIELLLKHGADITIKNARGKTPLHLAIESKQRNIIDLVLSAHSNVNRNPVDDKGLSHFHIACISNNIEMVKKFLLDGVDVNSCIDIDSVFWPGYSALHFATEFELRELVELLLEHGANIAAKNGIGLTPFDVAINCTDTSKYWKDEVENIFAIIESMLLVSPIMNSHSFDDRGFSLLHIYCIKNDTDAIKSFLYFFPEMINKSINWASSDWYGYTPLHFAVNFSSKEATELLLEKGADISIKNAEGNTPLHTVFGLRCQLRTIENPELIFTYENPVGDEGYSHFHIACDIGNLKAVEYFLERGVDVNGPTKFTGVYEYTGQMPLHLAVSNRETCVEMVQLLLKSGADINARDAELNTPLHYTKYNYNDQVAEILLSQGADINAQNVYNETPLYSTCSDGEYPDPECLPKRITFLLENGADINIENEDGETVLVLVNAWPDHIILNKSECLGILMRHIKKLKIIHSYVSIRNEQDYFRLLAGYQDAGIYKQIDFSKECLKELQHMKDVYIDCYTTLHDILFKKLNEMALHSENAAFREIVYINDFYRKFPIYGYLLKLQFQNGLKRRPLLEISKTSLNCLTAFPLPDACSEKIFQHLSNDDLQNIILSKPC